MTHSEERWVTLARMIYRDLRKGVGSAVDWRVADKYAIAISELAEIAKASRGHLRINNGIVEVVNDSVRKKA